MFRHLKHQNLFTGDDLIHNSGITYLVPFLAPKDALTLLANDSIILENQYGCLDPFNVKIYL